MAPTGNPKYKVADMRTAEGRNLSDRLKASGEFQLVAFVDYGVVYEKTSKENKKVQAKAF